MSAAVAAAPALEYPAPGLRRLITFFTLVGAFMTQLDATIANVALPHMQASTAASREQITWVLTSYIVMAATFTPLGGWLAGRFGRKKVFISSMIGFTIASALCGLATTLDQLIAFRLLQGMLGSALLPMSQAILLDINPPERHGSAMALWGMGAILGPIVGPVMGGWLTDNLSWRWVFYINLPFGVLAAAGLIVLLQDVRAGRKQRLDLFGFAALAISVASFQLMLDRGQTLDWFESDEIRLEALVAAMSFYLFVVHSFTTKRPFVSPAVVRDTNWLIGSLLGFFLGGLMYGVMALTAPMLAVLQHMPIEQVGIAQAPRGIGLIISTWITGLLMGRIDPRILIVVGMTVTAWSMFLMSGVSLEMDAWLVEYAGFIQGIGGGILFVPVATVTFSTLSPDLRDEGSAVGSLIRNMGGSMWISLLGTLTVRNEAIVHARLTEAPRPDNPIWDLHFPGVDLSAPSVASALDGEIFRQAMMVSYADAFWTLFLVSLAFMPLVLLVKVRRR